MSAIQCCAGSRQVRSAGSPADPPSLRAFEAGISPIYWGLTRSTGALLGGDGTDVVRPVRLAASASVLSRLDQVAAGPARLPGGVRGVVLRGIPIAFAEVGMLK